MKQPVFDVDRLAAVIYNICHIVKKKIDMPFSMFIVYAMSGHLLTLINSSYPTVSLANNKKKKKQYSHDGK